MKGKKPSEEISPKQQEVLELLINHIAKFGFQPTMAELCEILGVRRPAIRDRILYLVRKGFLTQPPKKAERCFGVVGLRFLPYFVDPDTGEVAEDQTHQLDGDYVAIIKKKKPKTVPA